MFFGFFIMQFARHTRPEGYFKVWATIIFVQRRLPPTPRAETGTPFTVHTDVGFGILSPKPGR